jgi:hypothetical protein
MDFDDIVSQLGDPVVTIGDIFESLDGPQTLALYKLIEQIDEYKLILRTLSPEQRQIVIHLLDYSIDNDH